MRTWIIVCVATLVVACGHRSGGGNGEIDAGGGGGGDGSVDGPPSSGMCTPGTTQCSNCVDDDKDGRTDGFDIQCTGSLDNDEGSFATGIPGDNMDAINQDCFFDGDSGGGNDGCNIHVCCLLNATDEADCQKKLNDPNVKYDPTKDCPAPSQQCIDACAKLTPPGCDCFGCCTICDPATNNCQDIIINPTTSPECGPTTLNDPTKCKVCTQSTTCGTPDCGGTSCVLCPGQDPNDLPASCNGTVCPNGETTCTSDSGCPEMSYCSAGCCIYDVIL